MSLKNTLKKWTGTTIGAALAPFTGGVSLLAGGMYDLQNQQTKANNKAIAAQNAANQAAIQQANAYDMYTWDLANQYNSPKAQVQRLIDAGFNPYTAGAISAGNASGAASSNGYAEFARNTVADRTGMALQMAQAGANLVNTWTAVRNGQAQRNYIDTQNAALQHNLSLARKNKVPVGQQESIPTAVSNVSNSIVDGILGKDSKNPIVRTGNALANKLGEYGLWNFMGDTAWKIKNYLTGNSSSNKILSR